MPCTSMLKPQCRKLQSGVPNSCRRKQAFQFARVDQMVSGHQPAPDCVPLEEFGFGRWTRSAGTIDVYHLEDLYYNNP